MHSSPSATSQSIVLNASRPLYWALTVFGVTPPAPCLTRSSTKFCKYKNNLIWFLFSIYCLSLLLLNVWISHKKLIVMDNLIDLYKLGILTGVLAKSQIIAIFLVQTFNMLGIFLRHRELQNIFQAIEQLEHDLRWCSLQSRLDIRSFLKRISPRRYLFIKSGCLMFFTAFFHTLINYNYSWHSEPFFARTLITIFESSVQFKSVEMFLMVEHIQLLLNLLHNEMEVIRQHSKSPTQRQRDRSGLYNALQIHRQWLARLWRLANDLDSYMWNSMLAHILYGSLAIINIVNWAYFINTVSDIAIYNIYSFLFIANLLVNMMTTCWLCQYCGELYEGFNRILHALNCDGQDVILSMCVHEYSLQLTHQKLIFSCNGFFDMNLKNFGAWILTIVTYVVILIQFRLQAETETEKNESS